jgi:predicted peroxiredoxin
MLMHYVVSATWGPTDPTRAMLPFIFAASAVQAGDTVTLMLFHDAVLMAMEGTGAKLVPVGPPNRYEDVASSSNVTLWACKPCLDARALPAVALDRRIKLGGMNDFHAALKQPNSQALSF